MVLSKRLGASVAVRQQRTAACMCVVSLCLLHIVKCFIFSQRTRILVGSQSLKR
eukprot:UN22155